jgi:hypothetical protein
MRETQVSSAGTLLESFGSENLFEYAYNRVFLKNSSLPIVFSLIAWWASRESACRRLFLLFPLATLLLWNPFCPHVIADNLTGTMTYYRLFWILPVLPSAALVLTMPLTFRTPSATTRTVLTACLIGVLVIVPQFHALRTHPLAAIALGRLRSGELQVLKVQQEYWVAEQVNQLAGKGNRVLAPEPVETWLTTWHDYAYPTFSRSAYFNIMGPHFTPQDREQRALAHRYISKLTTGRGPRIAFCRLIETDERLRVVCLRESHPLASEIAGILTQHGFRVRARQCIPRLVPKFHYEHLQIWERGVQETAASKPESIRRVKSLTAEVGSRFPLAQER